MENKFKIGGVYKYTPDGDGCEDYVLRITDIIEDKCCYQFVYRPDIECDTLRFDMNGWFASHLTLIEDPAEESKTNFVVGKRYRFKSTSESTFKSGVIEIVEEKSDNLYRYYTVEGMSDDEGCFTADSSFARALEPIDDEYDPPMKKLKVKFWRLRNVVCMQVLEQDDRTRGNLDFSYCGVNIRSRYQTEIDTADADKYILEETASTGSLRVSVRGNLESYDLDVACVQCENEDAAMFVIDRISCAIEAYNASLRATMKATKESDFEITIVGG